MMKGLKDEGMKSLNKKSPLVSRRGRVVLGDDLLSHLLQAVPSARPVLTSLFGMGRGVPRRYSHRNLVSPVWPAYKIDKPKGRRGSLKILFFSRSPSGVRSPSRGGKSRAISTARLCHRWLYTCGLSTSSSSTALERSLILRRVSHLDAFSAYLIRT